MRSMLTRRMFTVSLSVQSPCRWRDSMWFSDISCLRSWTPERAYVVGLEVGRMGKCFFLKVLEH